MVVNSHFNIRLNPGSPVAFLLFLGGELRAIRHVDVD